MAWPWPSSSLAGPFFWGPTSGPPVSRPGGSKTSCSRWRASCRKPTTSSNTIHGNTNNWPRAATPSRLARAAPRFGHADDLQHDPDHASPRCCLLVERAQRQVAVQLDGWIGWLATRCREMQVLISRLAPMAGSGWVRSHLRPARGRTGTAVGEPVGYEVETEGSQPLSNRPRKPGVFRIAQEALNNVVKHAGVSQAVVRLLWRSPFWMEVQDRGSGFDPRRADGQMGRQHAGTRRRDRLASAGEQFSLKNGNLRQGRKGSRRIRSKYFLAPQPRWSL